MTFALIRADAVCSGRMVFTATVLLQRHDEYMLGTFCVMQTSKIINETNTMRLRMKCFNLQLSARLIIHHILDGFWSCSEVLICFHWPAMWPLVKSCYEICGCVFPNWHKTRQVNSMFCLFLWLFYCASLGLKRYIHDDTLCLHWRHVCCHSQSYKAARLSWWILSHTKYIC